MPAVAKAAVHAQGSNVREAEVRVVEPIDRGREIANPRRVDEGAAFRQRIKPGRAGRVAARLIAHQRADCRFAVGHERAQQRGLAHARLPDHRCGLLMQ